MTIEELIERDYRAALDFIDKCDEHLFKIRNWTLFTVSAVIAYAFHSKISWICLGNFLIVFSFLYLELVYKSFQDDIIELTRDIDRRYEEALNEKKDDIWNDYIIGMGRHITRPSIKKVFITFIHIDKRHILTFYLLLCMFSLMGFMAIELVFSK